MAELQSSYTPPEPFVCGKPYRKQVGTNWEGEPVYEDAVCPVKAVDMREIIEIEEIVKAFYDLESKIKDDIKSLRDDIGNAFADIDSNKLYVNGDTISNLSTDCTKDVSTISENISSGLAEDQSFAISKYENKQEEQDGIAMDMKCEASESNGDHWWGEEN